MQYCIRFQKGCPLLFSLGLHNSPHCSDFATYMYVECYMYKSKLGWACIALVAGMKNRSARSFLKPGISPCQQMQRIKVKVVASRYGQITSGVLQCKGLCGTHAPQQLNTWKEHVSRTLLCKQMLKNVLFLVLQKYHVYRVLWNRFMCTL